jgi:hypothetical protein
LTDLTGPDPQNPVLVQLTQLRELELNNNFLTDVYGLDMLVWLDTLDLLGNGGITCDDLAHLDAVLITTMISHHAICVSPDGDINEDGQVNIVDVLMGISALLGSISLSGSQLAHADVAPLAGGVPASDGLFTAGDMLVLQRKVLGIN